jgi:A/G-specific adenine glycosylase
LVHVQRALLAWHRENGLRAPWRESRDPYHVLVAAVMAQQTQMSRVMPAYERFLTSFPTIDALAAASTAGVIRAWAGMGYNQRALRLQRAARTAVADGWPHNAAALVKIEGIGPFTAAIIASFAFGEPAACVDTNVRRVLGRLAGDPAIGAGALQRLADRSLAVKDPARWNQAVMDYGARVCTPRPKCEVCVVAEWCAWHASNSDAPALPMVAEERASYVAKPARRSTTAAADDGARRYYRGRTIDVLRGLPAGKRIEVGAIAALLGDRHPTPTPAEMRALVDGLVRDGLAALDEGDGIAAVSLPED